MRAAREVLVECFPACDPVAIGHAVRDAMRLDTFVVDHGTEVETYTVVSLRIDDLFVPETVCGFAHIPYAVDKRDNRPPASAEIGVFVTAEPVLSGGATRVRFSRDGDHLEAEVVADHAVVYVWDVPWLCKRHQPRPVALLIDEVWHRTIPTHAALPKDFAAAYAAYRGTGDEENWWAISAFFDAESWDERFALALILVDAIDKPDAPWIGVFAAGPIEDLLCHDLMDHIEGDTARTALWQTILDGTYWHLEPPDVQDRVRRFLDCAPAA